MAAKGSATQNVRHMRTCTCTCPRACHDGPTRHAHAPPPRAPTTRPQVIAAKKAAEEAKKAAAEGAVPLPPGPPPGADVAPPLPPLPPPGVEGAAEGGVTSGVPAAVAGAKRPIDAADGAEVEVEAKRPA